MKKLVGLIGMLLPLIAMASNEQGTGVPETGGNQRIIGSNQVILEMPMGQQNLLGVVDAANEYSVINLIRFDASSGSHVQWGSAEVVLGCFEADVLLYPAANQDLEPTAVRVSTDYCAE